MTVIFAIQFDNGVAIVADRVESYPHPLEYDAMGIIGKYTDGYPSDWNVKLSESENWVIGAAGSAINFRGQIENLLLYLDANNLTLELWNLFGPHRTGYSRSLILLLVEKKSRKVYKVDLSKKPSRINDCLVNYFRDSYVGHPEFGGKSRGHVVHLAKMEKEKFSRMPTDVIILQKAKNALEDFATHDRSIGAPHIFGCDVWLLRKRKNTKPVIKYEINGDRYKYKNPKSGKEGVFK